MGRDDLVPRPPAEAPASAFEADSGVHPVQLWFKGIPEPVSARAALADGSLQLKADLPFLELDSIVGVATAIGGARLHGHVSRVTFAPLEDRRVPQLCVDIALTDSDASAAPQLELPLPPRVRKAAAIGGIAPALRGGAIGGIVEPGEVARGASGGRRALGWLAALVVGAACGAAVALAWIAPRLQTLEGRGNDAQASAAPTSRPAAVVPAPEPGARADSVEPEVSIAVAVDDDGADAPIAEVSLERYDLLAPRSPIDDEGALSTAEGGWTAAVASAQAAAAATQLPQVSVHGAQTHVFVPMEGEGRGLRQYELTTPGIAVTVPYARALIPLDNYNIQRGIVRRVWLRREGEGVQVRVITRRTATRAAASYDETGLSVVLEP